MRAAISSKITGITRCIQNDVNLALKKKKMREKQEIIIKASAHWRQSKRYANQAINQNFQSKRNDENEKAKRDSPRSESELLMSFAVSASFSDDRDFR
uniref:Methylcobalamin:com methyltransferase n=1 Tax=Rhizophora mucronata TaxID=61149 RepID=A0A2P2K217_RHIMU